MTSEIGAAHPLDSLFRPRSIAVIGASREATKIPGLLLAFLRRNGFAGEIFPVNPRYDDIEGLRCYPSIAAIGRAVDLAVLVIPARFVLEQLDACAAAGVRNALVISSGFAEGGGSHDAQHAMAALARRSGMRICGPNSEGFYNEPAKVAATFSPTVDVKADAPRLLATRKRVGIVAQSGGIGFALYQRARAMGVAVSHVISTGNEADVAAGEVFGYLAQDAATDVILMFIEGVRDGAAFRSAARAAASAGKPVVVCKAGRTPAGQRAAASHTASMAGWSAAYDAVFAADGLTSAADIDEAVAIAAAFAAHPLPRGHRVAVVSASGGAGAWMADVLTEEGLVLPELSEPLQAEIRGLIPAYGSPRNPVDVTAQAVHSGGLQVIVERLSRCDEVDLIVVVLSLSSETRMPLKPAEIGPVVAAQRKPILVHSYTLPSSFARTGLAEAGVVVFSGLETTGQAAGALVRRAQFSPAPPQVAAVPSAALAAYVEGCRGPLSEYESKVMLRDAGLAMPLEILARHRDEVATATAQLGFPLAMKIQSRDIPHKSDIGGVILNIDSLAAAEAAYDRLAESARLRRPDAQIIGVLISPMARHGIEMIVGTMRDAVFGPMVMVGFGGVAAEIYKDVVYRPAPVTAAQAGRMIDQLKGAALLDGFRGGRKADRAALAEVIAQLSDQAVAISHVVAEIDLNPVIVHGEGEGVSIIDALVVAALEQVAE